MPTRLDRDAISRAIDHLVRYGDTDVFPHLIELTFLAEEKDSVVDEIAALDLDQFAPQQAIEAIAPKGKISFRIVHQLQLLETLLFTASVLEVAGDLESLKRPVGDASGPFAYRFVPGTDASVFMPDHTYRDWLQWQQDRLQAGAHTEIVITDIADFFQRIYAHRVENCLDIATPKKGLARFIERLIKSIRSRQSHGIPVGGTASRILAEALLADTDNALADDEIEFTRFVDDYRLFLKEGQSAYSTLALLAEQLAVGEGLSLNTQKTRMLTRDEFAQRLERESGDAFEDAQAQALQALSNSLYFDEEASQEDVDSLRAFNLIEMLGEELTEEYWDFGRIRAIFRGMRLAPEPDSIFFIISQFKELLPFMKEVALYLHAWQQVSPAAPDDLKAKVIEEICSGAASSVSMIRIWLLELFVRGIISIDHKQLSKLPHGASLDNRQKFLIRGRNGDVNFFRKEKTRFEERTTFEKYAFIIGATCLPRDEFVTWVGAIKPNMHRPLDHKFCEWAKGKHGQLVELLDARVTAVVD